MSQSVRGSWKCHNIRHATGSFTSIKRPHEVSQSLRGQGKCHNPKEARVSATIINLPDEITIIERPQEVP